MITPPELRQRWPEGTLYERHDLRGTKNVAMKFIDMVYVIARKPTDLEIIQAAQYQEIDMLDGKKSKPLKVAWYLGNPNDLGVEMRPV